MRALIPARCNLAVQNAEVLDEDSTPRIELLGPLLELAKSSHYLVAGSIGEFISDGLVHHIPRFIFQGEEGGGDLIRLAIFAGLYGDEPEGTEGVVKFLAELEQQPSLAKNYHVYVYPISNPAAVATGKRNNSSGRDLVRQLWKRSNQPEAYYIERELGVIGFQGVISLRGASESTQFTAKMSSPILFEAVAQPAVDAANRWFKQSLVAPRTVSPSFFTQTNELKVTPFEIILEHPRQASRYNQIDSIAAALHSVMENYREISSLGQNI